MTLSRNAFATMVLCKLRTIYFGSLLIMITKEEPFAQ